MVNFKEDERLNTLNHSCAHVMAQAVKHLYPHAKFWVGPVVKEGFYYDIDLGDNVINDEAIEAIEKEMKKICKEGKKIYRREVSKQEALEMFKDDMYKLDLISGLEDGNITVYDQGDFTDLCRGPHVDNTKLCKNFKLVKYSGVYWKGDANNHVMQRIYGVCFPTVEIPFIIAGKNVRKGGEFQESMMQFDTAATMGYVFGVKQPQVWIGRPMIQVFK